MPEHSAQTLQKCTVPEPSSKLPFLSARVRTGLTNLQQLSALLGCCVENSASSMVCSTTNQQESSFALPQVPRQHNDVAAPTTPDLEIPMLTTGFASSITPTSLNTDHTFHERHRGAFRLCTPIPDIFSSGQPPPPAAAHAVPPLALAAPLQHLQAPPQR